MHDSRHCQLSFEKHFDISVNFMPVANLIQKIKFLNVFFLMYVKGGFETFLCNVKKREHIAIGNNTHPDKTQKTNSDIFLLQTFVILSRAQNTDVCLLQLHTSRRFTYKTLRIAVIK